MKKSFILLVALFSLAISVNAQIMRTEELEKYAKEKYGEKWMIDQCYPFVQKDKHKKTSSKALIMTHAFSNVIMDKIQEAVQNGVTGNENDNW
jgi:hypothetical protein